MLRNQTKPIYQPREASVKQHSPTDRQHRTCTASPLYRLAHLFTRVRLVRKQVHGDTLAWHASASTGHSRLALQLEEQAPKPGKSVSQQHSATAVLQPPVLAGHVGSFKMDRMSAQVTRKNYSSGEHTLLVENSTATF